MIDAADDALRRSCKNEDRAGIFVSKGSRGAGSGKWDDEPVKANRYADNLTLILQNTGNVLEALNRTGGCSRAL